MSFVLPPIVKLAERLLVEIEQAVRRFARYHKYSIGADLRARAMQVAQLAHRAWRDRAQQHEWTRKLVWAVDDLKLNLQLGSRVRALDGIYRTMSESVETARNSLHRHQRTLLNQIVTLEAVQFWQQSNSARRLAYPELRDHVALAD